MRKQIIIHKLILFITITICCINGYAQNMVYSGDTDNNGVVNYLDVLNVCYAYGATGPTRTITPGSNLSQIIVPWAQDFPDGLNYAYADANGDGIVNVVDLMLVNNSYGDLNGLGDNQVYVDGGSEEHHARLFFENSGVVRVTGGDEVEIPLVFQNNQLFASPISSVGFMISGMTPYIDEVNFEFTAIEDNFLLQNENGITYVAPSLDERRVEASLAQYGAGGIVGEGVIGIANIVIEDNIIALLPAGEDSIDIVISVNNIAVHNENFWSLPIVKDSIKVRVIHPDIMDATPTEVANVIEDKSIKVSPNPFAQTLSIRANTSIEKVEVYSPLGDLILQVDTMGEEVFLDVGSKCNGGIYFCQVYTQKGVATKKILHIAH